MIISLGLQYTNSDSYLNFFFVFPKKFFRKKGNVVILYLNEATVQIPPLARSVVSASLLFSFVLLGNDCL